MGNDICLWEILVPTVSNSGKPFRTRYHKVWDEKVKKISGGLTIIPPVKGYWVDTTDSKEYIERNIPVRIACTRDQIIEIMRITKVYYDQIDIMAYKISDDVIFLSDMKE